MFHFAHIVKLTHARGGGCYGICSWKFTSGTINLHIPFPQRKLILIGTSEAKIPLKWGTFAHKSKWMTFFRKSPSSSSIGCGAGDHKVSPCTTIISKCGNLLFLHCSFIIPKQSLYIIKVWSTWSTRSPLPIVGMYRAYLLAGSSFDIRRMWPRNFSWRCLTR